jgi:hypothetical protein
MENLKTGRAYDLYGTPETLQEIWPQIKVADPKAVLLMAPSDNLATIGTDVKECYTIGVGLIPQKK